MGSGSLPPSESHNTVLAENRTTPCWQRVVPISSTSVARTLTDDGEATTGASTKELMRRSGHASPVAALRYQHATDGRDQAIADALSRLDRPAPVVAIGEAQATASRPERAHRTSGQDMKSL